MPSKTKTKVKKTPAAPPASPPMRMDERAVVLEARLRRAPIEVQRRYREDLDVSWIAHDSAIEGTVYTLQELKAAIDPTGSSVADSSLQPACDEIRRHRDALQLVRDYALKEKSVLTLDFIKKIYVTLHPSEGDVKTVKYRKDIPQHRLYFHEYAAPDKIAPKLRQIVDWANAPETIQSRNAIRIATRAHYDILRVFPFTLDSGKVARLVMNFLLLRAGYPPAIVHSTERQRYYEALKGSPSTMMTIVLESLENSLASIEKLLDSYDQRNRFPFR